MMIRIKHIATLLGMVVLLLIAMPHQLCAQVAGALYPTENALNKAFQHTEGWSGASFKEPQSFLERSYLNFGYNYGSEFRTLNSNNSMQVGYGFRLAPVHALELDYTYHFMEWGGNSSSVGLTYLFNLTSYAYKLEQPKRWQVTLNGGIEANLRGNEISEWGASAAMRMQYNLPFGVGIYAEPKATLFAGGAKSHMRSSISTGLSVDLNFFNEAYYHDTDNKELLFALKTNLLYDLLLVPNLSLALPIGDAWSVEGEFMRGWWLRPDNTFCWQIEAFGLEGRYWLDADKAERKLSGWYLGAFTHAGFYDIQLHETRGVQGDFYVAAGISGGYSLPIARNFNLEFGTGVGYMLHEYQHYNVVRGERLIADGGRYRSQSLMPLKANISLVWIIKGKEKKGAKQ